MVKAHGIPDGVRERPTKAVWIIRDTDVEKKVGALWVAALGSDPRPRTQPPLWGRHWVQIRAQVPCFLA